MFGVSFFFSWSNSGGVTFGINFLLCYFFLICLFLQIAWGKRIFSPRPPIKNGRPGTVPICRNSKSGVGFGCSNRPANRQRQTDQTHPTKQPCFPFSSLLSMSLRQSFEFWILHNAHGFAQKSWGKWHKINTAEEALAFWNGYLWLFMVCVFVFYHKKPLLVCAHCIRCNS